MGCFFALLGLISPRLALIVIALFSDLLSRAFDGVLVPLIGFFLVPWTTLMTALVYSSGDRVSGFEWVLVAAAFVVDLGSMRGIGKLRRRRD